MIALIQKYILQFVIGAGLILALYAYYTITTSALSDAADRIKVLEQDNGGLVREIKGLKEQAKIDKDAVVKNRVGQESRDAKQTVAMEEVQHEVTKLLQTAPAKNPEKVDRLDDAISTAILNGMWRSYDDSVRGATVSPP